jgi:RNA polymerase sigma-70 factor (ECF subfamily)
MIESWEAWDWQAARRRCVREARRVAHDRAAVEDLAQEALIRAWRARKTSGSPDAPDAWLATITRNEALRWASRARCRREVSHAEPHAAGGDSTPAGTDAIVDRITVQDLLHRLPAPDRQMLELRYHRDLTQREIAELLDLPEGTVKIRLHRLRAKLARELT